MPSNDPLAGLRPVFDVVKKINSEPDIRKLLGVILETTIQLCNAKRGTLVLFKGDKERARLSRDGKGRGCAERPPVGEALSGPLSVAGRSVLGSGGTACWAVHPRGKLM